MRSLRCAAAVLAASIASTATAGAQQSEARSTGAPAQVQWLTGCWAGAAGADTFEEHWMPLRAGTLVGTGRATRGERTTSIELMVIRMRGDTLAFHAFPVGQEPAVFPAESVSDSAVVFANPAHDFPQRISYRRVGGDSLVARVEGPGDDGPRGFDYHLRRVTCPIR
jgi:hypothetical protein